MTDPDVEVKLLELANLLNTLAGAGVEDGALAIFVEAMSIIRQQEDLPKWEVLFLQRMLNFQSESLFPEDCRRYKRRIIELAIEHADTFTADPSLSPLGIILDKHLGDLPDEDRSRLGPLFERVSAAYSRPSLRELEFTPNIDEDLPAEILEKYASLARLYYDEDEDEGAPPAPDISDLHDDLCALLEDVELPQGSRHTLLADIHYRTMRAGMRIGQLSAILIGANALFDEPRTLSSQSDRTEAAHIILLTLGHSQRAPSEGPPEILAKITEFIWDSLRMIFRNNVIRFVALGLDRLFPLLAAYVDHLLAVQGSGTEALELVFAFQSALTTVALHLLAEDRPDEQWPEFIIDELDSLLRGQVVGSAEDQEADPSLTAVRGQHPAPLSLTGPPPPSRGYEEREFVIQTVPAELTDFTPPNIDSVQRDLAPETALVCLFASEQTVYGGCLTVGTEPAMRRLCSLEQLEHHSLELTGWLHHGKERFLLEPDDFGWIHELLIDPILADVPDSVRSLVLLAPQVPLPLHLAYNRDHFLLDDYAVTYSYSAYAHHRFVSVLPGAPDHALIFDGSRSLRFAEGELTSIVAALETRFRVTRYARRQEIMTPSAEARVVHYAGHMSSRIGDHRWSFQLEDGTVVPSELLRCVGRQTQLVSLFSCYSADQIGATPTPIGISTLLHGVGVQNVVGCLWPIPDETASRIATGLYRGCLEDGLTIAESLRLAMLRERSWSPGVWGSVVCFGPPESAL